MHPQTFSPPLRDYLSDRFRVRGFRDTIFSSRDRPVDPDGIGAPSIGLAAAIGFVKKPPKVVCEFQHARFLHDTVGCRAETMKSEPVGYPVMPTVIGIGRCEGVLLPTDKDHRIAGIEDRRLVHTGGDLADVLRGSQSSWWLPSARLMDPPNVLAEPRA